MRTVERSRRRPTVKHDSCQVHLTSAGPEVGTTYAYGRPVARRVPSGTGLVSGPSRERMPARRRAIQAVVGLQKPDGWIWNCVEGFRGLSGRRLAERIRSKERADVHTHTGPFPNPQRKTTYVAGSQHTDSTMCEAGQHACPASTWLPSSPESPPSPPPRPPRPWPSRPPRPWPAPLPPPPEP